MISINFPSSAAWNEAILPAIESHSTPKQFSSILDSVATQLTNSSIGPDQVSFSENNDGKKEGEEKSTSTKNNNKEKEKQALVNVGARIIIESIMASFVPGTNEETVKNLLLQGQQQSSSSSSMSSMSISGQPLKSEGHAAAAASVWMKYGKKIVNAQRTRSIEEVCQRVLTTTTTNASQKDDDANILRYLSSEVRVCTRSVDESGEDMEVRKDNLFQPMANFAIAAENCDQQQQQSSQQQQSAAPVMLQLSTDETYNFLCEIDAIQKKLDELRG